MEARCRIRRGLEPFDKKRSTRHGNLVELFENNSSSKGVHNVRMFVCLFVGK